jgi:hypothetical protein
MPAKLEKLFVTKGKRTTFRTGIPLPKNGQRDLGLRQGRCRDNTVWHSLEQALTTWSCNSDDDDYDDDDGDVDDHSDEEIYYEQEYTN